MFCTIVLTAILISTTGTLTPAKTSSVDHTQQRTLVPPIVINTWNFTSANARAWQELAAQHSALDAVEYGCGQCEIDRCDGTVGWGGSPSETGETTLDAMIMDGDTYDVGAVGGLRRVKSAIAVARLVLERTNHTLLVGEMATQFALSFGFREESLTSDESRKSHQDWLANSCQPNYWKNVEPDPRLSCGPYHLLPREQQQAASKDPHGRLSSGSAEQRTDQTSGNSSNVSSAFYSLDDQDDQEGRLGELASPPRQPDDDGKNVIEFVLGHDTVGMIAMDSQRRLASGTSTNGLRNKILGRVGDSPVAGAGSYADKDAGAAAATGDGDVIMRFLLSYQAVENLRQGMSAEDAAWDVVKRQAARTGRPYAHAAVVVLSKSGSYGAACSGFSQFPYVISDAKQQIRTSLVECIV